MTRQAEPADISALSRLWHDGWHDAHASIVPARLALGRTREAFRARLQRGLAEVRAIGPRGDPDGFCWVRNDELHQLYVHRRARHRGMAARLMGDAERRLAASGATRAWLACAIGNERAELFYEKSGWSFDRVMTIALEIPGGRVALDVSRYAKMLDV
jgi:GNAT superfamily N-acetyltransferase